MNARSILRSKTAAILSAGVLGAGLLGGVALAAAPTTAEMLATTAPDTNAATATAEKAKGKLKAMLDGLVAKNVITQAQEDAIIGALGSVATQDHPKLREFVGDVANESVRYLGLPADQVKQQLRAGKGLGDIATGTPNKSRDGLITDLDTAAATRIRAAVAAGTLTQAQADQLTPKVDNGILKIVDHTGSPKPAATN
ncbi:MAG TPA: hypothetical protein VGS17_03125 [Candidatus Limnocylindria bacterium]|nr:hypothetical protein [Candidatus Limnocylindria bacterium]